MDDDVVISPERASLLDDAVAAVCSEAVCALTGVNGDEITGRLRSCLFTFVNAALDNFLLRLNGPDPAAALPPELLAHIFEFLEFEDRISTSHVCRRWRNVSLGATAALWTDVVTVNPKPGVLTALLERAQGLPVTLEVTVIPDNVDELSVCLQEHMHHIRLLSLEIKHILGDDQDAALSDALHTDGPMLQRFLFFNPSSPFVYRPIDESIFRGCAPNLRVVKFQGDIAPFMHTAAAFDDVRTLVYSQASWNLRHDLGCIFTVFPGLEGLTVDVDEWDGVGDEPLSFPKSLTRLVMLSNADDFDPCDVLEIITEHTTNIRDIFIQFETSTPSLERGLRVLLQFFSTLRTVTYLALGLTMVGSMYSQLQDCYGQRRTVMNVPLLSKEQWPVGAFAGLTTLLISDTSWAAALPLPSMPALLELDLRMLRPKLWAELLDESVFMMSPQDTGAVLVCPLLRTLAITGRPHDDPQSSAGRPTLAPEAVKDFIERRLDYDADVLDRLVFRGTRLLETSASEVARLLAIVNILDVEDGRPSITAGLEDLLTWE